MRARQHHDGIQPDTLALALTCLATQFPDRQLNATELCIATGIGRTAMSKISAATDTPFALRKCTASRLNAWLQTHPGFKAS
ncbi:MAG: hypothetical protein QOH88_23 [Verrucomicrobiota bacterium]|jgi:hypothetical protein